MMLKTNCARGFLLATTALVAQVLTVPAMGQTEEEKYAAYRDSLYQYCDAKKIAAVWNRSVYEAKGIIGDKILANLQDLADQDIASTENSVSCDWAELGLDYDDAVDLAEFWGGEPHEAKQKAAEMASEMGAKRFIEVMTQAIDAG